MAENPRVFGKYEVIRRLAVGGMGEIFLARQVGVAGFDRLVILKSLLPQLAEDADMLGQFLDEARIVGSINHPSVVACYEVGEWEGVYFIAMEYVNGVDVAQLQKSCEDAAQRFPINAALAIVREAALGLDSAHHATDAHGRPLRIVHRDISPHNVMVRADGLAKVVDFGVAVAANRQKRTEGGLLKGKLGYMAPEQIKGQPVEPRSDQFSLGVMAWELLTGRRLFVGESPEAVFMKIVREPVPPPSSVLKEIPPDVDFVIQKMTAQLPEQRYARLAEPAAVIRKILDTRGAHENEAADLVRDLAGAQLAARVKDLSPSPVRILGITQPRVDGAGGSTPLSNPRMCPQCGTQAVGGDRFCRSCGFALQSKSATPNKPFSSPPPTASEVVAAQAAAARGEKSAATAPPAFVEVGDDEMSDIVEDVSMDDASGPREMGVAIGIIEIVDYGGHHRPKDEMVRPIFSSLEELAARYGGAVMTAENKVTATFVGNGRAARGAMAFGRRAAALVNRAHRDLRMRVGVGAMPGMAHGDTTMKDDAERIVMKAKPGQILVSDRARVLATVSHAYSPGPTIPPSASSVKGKGAEANNDVIETWDLPQPMKIIGRAAERLVVEQALAAADVGRGQQLMFLGDAGAGKSTLLDAVDTDARDRGFVVARARCARSRAPLHFDALRQAVKSACTELLVVAKATGAWHKALEALPLSAHERRRLRSLVDDEPIPGDDIPPARRRVLTRAALHGFFAAVAERRGICIVLDDVHKGDASSLELFAELGARQASARFVLVAAGRPMQGERALPLARRLVLDALDDKDLTGVIATALTAAPPPEVAQKVLPLCKGNPLLAVLYARFLASIQLVRLEAEQAFASKDLARYPMPPNLDVLSFASNALLSPAARAVLEAAAVIGQAADMNELRALVGHEVDADEALSELFMSGALVPEGALAAFPSSSELDAVIARTPPNVARTLHARLAELISGLAASDPGAAVHERALFHRLAVDDRETAALHAERAADAWSQLGAAEASIAHYRRALQARWRLASGGAVSEEQGQAAFALAARATTAIGEVEQNQAVDLVMPLLRAVPEGTAQVARVEAIRTRAALLLKMRRGQEALAILDDVLDKEAQNLPPAMDASLLIDLALAMEACANPDGARTQLGEAIRQLQALPAEERTRMFDALLAHGRLSLRARDLARARESLGMALEEAKRQKSTGPLIDVLSVMSSLEQSEGNVDRALALLDDALSAAASVGDGVADARLKQQAARMLQQLGRIAEALQVAKQALLVSQRLGWDEGAAVAAQLVASLEARV
jgi:serine/threonine protein kinase/tetratricopeptide (TPR) repeat protein